MIIQNLYNIILLIAASVNITMGCALLAGNSSYGDYTVYRRSRLLTALTFLIFAAGFIAHSRLGWRATWPAGASALSVSYFHVAAVLFGWSHISLLNPNYLTRRIVVRDIVILVVGIIAYWTAATSFSLVTFHCSLLIFFLHALYISYIFYHTLVRVRIMTGRLPQSDDNARWWTDDNRKMVMRFQRSIRVSCHLIIIFGLGSIVVTAAFPTEQWPYIILMALGIAVFCYIYYGLTNYGTVIEAGTNATEDVAEGKRSHQRLVLTLALMMTALTAWADSEDVSYIDADGTSNSQSATILAGSTSPTTLDAGWYAVKENVTYNGQLKFNGDVCLILCDGATITASSGSTNALQVEGNLTIYAQSSGSGVLETNTTYTASGIHANNNGHITINGGHITTQTTNGPGISASGNGSITIHGGNVETNCTSDHGLRAKYITLGWRNTADRIKVKKYELEGGGVLAVAAGKVFTDGNGATYNGTLNSTEIAAIAGETLTPYGITLTANPHGDGYWTTFYSGTQSYRADATVYTAAVNGNKVNLTDVGGGVISAGNAVLLKAAATPVILQLNDAAASTLSDNELKGGATVEAGNTAYTLAAEGGVLGFYKFVGAALNPNRAHLEVTTTLAPEYLGFDENTTEVGTLNIERGTLNDDSWFTLDGRKLSGKPTKKGIYIYKGKKVKR